MEVCLDLFMMAVDTGDINAAENIKKLPMICNVPFVKRRSECTHKRHRCHIVRKFVSYRYRLEGLYWQATRPMFHFTQQPLVVHNYPTVGSNIALAPRFLLRGYYWTRLLVDVQLRRDGLPVQSFAVWARADSQSTDLGARYYEYPLPYSCGCSLHHSMHHDPCETCAPNDFEELSVVLALEQHIRSPFCSVRRLTRCHHVAAHRPEMIYWPIVDTITDWNDIMDRPDQTVGLNGTVEWPRVLPCVESISISATFPYYARIPHGV